MLVNIETNTLKAVASLVAFTPRGRVKGMVPALELVRIGEGYAVATDRYVLGAIRVPEFDEVEGEVLLSEASLKVLGAAKSLVTFDTETRTFTVVGTGVAVSAEPEGQWSYPPVLRLIPERGAVGERATDWLMSPSNLALLAKLKDPTTGKALEGVRIYAPKVGGGAVKPVLVESRGESVDGLPLVRAVMMPMH